MRGREKWCNDDTKFLNGVERNFQFYFDMGTIRKMSRKDMTSCFLYLRTLLTPVLTLKDVSQKLVMKEVHGSGDKITECVRGLVFIDKMSSL